MQDLNLPNLQNSTAIVTGAAGFCGSHLTRALLNKGIKTTALVRSGSDSHTIEELKRLGAKIVIGDINDKASLRQAFQGQNYIFHLAALFRQARFPDSEYMKVNFEGTRNVLEIARECGVRRVVHCSTNGVHSDMKRVPANEDEPYSPTDIYQHSKCEAEKFAREFAKAEKPEVVIVRPAMIWGEGDRRILKLFRGIHKGIFPIIGSGKTYTHWIHIDDLANAFMLAADVKEAKGQTYLIAGKDPIYFEDLVKIIYRIAGKKPWPFKIPAWPIQLLGSVVEAICRPLGIEPPIHRRRADFFIKNRAFDISKAKRELKFAPTNSVEHEARRIYNWYQEHGWLT